MPLPMRTFVAFMLLLLAWKPSPGQSTRPDLTQMTLEDLMNVEVTAVARKQQKVARTAAAVFVITQDDIRRSAATNIPELLRMVPGVQVAQINANTWAVAVRGFNGEYSNKLLVLLDGRSVYLPTTSGVFWDLLDVPLEDIERIEVVRGPGGTAWGANAVNGVINIITRKAADTPGGMLIAGGGNLDQGFGTAQYGGSLGTDTHYRVFTKFSNFSRLPDPNGNNAQDAWNMFRAGFRADTRFSDKDGLSLQGDLYRGHESALNDSLQSVARPFPQEYLLSFEMSGGYLQAEWSHRHSERAQSTLLASFDRYNRPDALGEIRNTFNLNFEEHYAWQSRQDLVFGVGYRDSASTTRGNSRLWLNPANLHTRLYSGFVQDEITAIPNHLFVTLGTKLEHNYYSGFGIMPGARVAWEIDSHRMAWTSFSRAIRTPSGADAALNINAAGFLRPDGLPAVVRIVGNPDVQDEFLNAYDVGYRHLLLDRLSLDLAAYYNQYDQLNTHEPLSPFLENAPSPPHLVFPLFVSNRMKGETHGVEVAANSRFSHHWSVNFAYAFEQLHLQLDRRSGDQRGLARAQGTTPRQWARVDSHLRIARNLFWDASLIFTGRLAYQNVPSHTRFDTQFTWPIGERLSFTVAGQNLLRDRQLEFNNDIAAGPSSMSTRRAFAKLTWWF